MPKFNAIGPAVTEKQQVEIFVTSPQVSRATCHSGYWHDLELVPYTVEGMGGTHQRRPLVNRAFGSRVRYYPSPVQGGLVQPPLRFFADSEKTAARSAAGFWATLWGKPCAIFGKKNLTRSGQVTEL